MNYYKIQWKKSALKELKQIDKKYINKLIQAVEKLASDPYPNNSKKLMGTSNSYRIRIGDYRVVYNVEVKAIIIEVVRVGHRKGVYRKI